jgi:O-antigen ligase/tetratricopeptide (TPR) repeat protein
MAIDPANPLETNQPPGGRTAPTRVRREVRIRRKKSRRGPLRKIRRRLETLTPESVAATIDRIIQAALVALLVLAPLPLGSVAPWARSIVFAASALLFLLWILRGSVLGRIEIVQTRLWGLLALYVCILFFQLLPLPHALLSILSPKTADLYTRLIPGYPDDPSFMPLSLSPHATAQEILRVSSLFLLFFVLVHHLRDRSRVNLFLWVLAALGLFEALYGLGERFSGSPHIFWITPPDRLSVHGTYYNRNHFAGLMEMLTPAVCGLLMSLFATRQRVSWRRSRLSLGRRLTEGLSKASTYRNLLLGLVVAAMFVAGCLSLSRGGMLGLVVGFFILFLFAAGRGGESSRRASLPAAAVVAVLIVVAGLLLYRGLTPLIDRFEQLAEEDSSWTGRAALRAAGLAMIRDFPALGAGGGAFGDVFHAYQPDRYGDKIAVYLHNDWLQVPCETGLAGALALYGALAIFLVQILRRIAARKDSYCRFVFAGAFAGLTAMLVHSFFDFNLYMVTANGIVFVTLAAICHAAAYMQGRRKDSAETFRVVAIPLSNRTGLLLRAALPVLVLAGALAASSAAVRAGLADRAFNIYLAWALGEPETYHFWKVRAPADAAEAKTYLDRATVLDPGSPAYAFHEGLFRIRTVAGEVDALARELARSVLLKDRALDGEDPVQRLAQEMTRELTRQQLQVDEDSEEFKSLSAAFLVPARRRLEERILSELEAAEREIRRAIRTAPTVPWLHMDLAVAWATHLAPGPELDRQKPKIEKLVEDARFLAPARPATLYRAGWYYAMEALYFPAGKTEEELQARREEAIALFRKAVRGEPRKYAVPVYSMLLDEIRADPQVLLDLTPVTLPSQAALHRFLSSRRLWSEAFETTGKILSLLGIDPATDGVGLGYPPGSQEFETAEKFTRTRLQLARRLGRASDAVREQARFGRFQADRCALLLQDGLRLADLGRYLEAVKACRDCLALDHNHLDALLTLAEIHARPGQDRTGEARGEILHHLVRALGAQSAAVAPAQCERILQVLTALEPRSPTEHLERQFVEALAELRCGQPEEAARKLEAMLLVKVPAFAYWQQRHLIHFQLGQALESSGRPEEAAAQYQEALSRAPNCRAAAERLAALGGGSTTQDVQQQSVEDRLRALTPKTFWQIDFSGRFQLLGTTMTPVRANAEQANGISDLGAVAANPDGLSAPSAEAEAPEAGWAPAFIANYYWIVLDDLDPALYDVTYRYLDAEGNVLFVDRKPLTPEASPGASSPPVSGIGVVCVHQSAVPLPLGTAREVQMQVRRAPRDKVPAETLAPDTGEPLMTLGLVASSNQGG